MTRSAKQYLEDIKQASVYDVAVQSDLQRLDKLSETLGNEIWLKREDQQPVKSFKLRGAYNKLSQLSEAQLAKGVVASSAGNHAQGVAYSARKKQVKAVIVMPATAPDIKVEAVRNFGSQYVEIVLHGSSFDEAKAEALRLSHEHGYTMVAPFDDEDVIVGQGTIARELLAQNPDLDTLFIAVGGGGLIAGMSVFLKQLKPDIKIIAIESDESACLRAAMTAGKPVPLDHVGIFADGVAVKIIGEEPFRLCQEYVDDVITVNTDEICAAIKDIFDDTRVIAEPAGALSIAGMRKYLRTHPQQDKKFGGILCGANINFHTLRYVSERCELGEQKEAVIAVKIPEKTGAFRKFCALLGGRAITEFNYRYATDKEAHVFVGIRLRGGQTELKQLTDSLTVNGYQSFDLSENEMAKLHVRYMVGGRSPTAINEKLFSFEFPEHPGALMKFLDTLGERFDITLFHYRNHGAAEGLVLAGFDIADGQRDDFNQHLAELNYVYQEQTNNPAYQFFLSGLKTNNK